MGMQAGLEQIPTEQLKGFIEKPRTAYQYYLDDLNDELASALPEALRRMAEAASNPELPPETKVRTAEGMKQFQAMLSALQPSSEKPRIPSASKRKKFSLEKDWHVLHYALNGTAEAGEGWLSQAVLGGKEFPDHENVMGYGPLRYLVAEEVSSVASALSAVDPNSLLTKLNRDDAESKRIYLARTLTDLNDWSYLPELFVTFRAFYADATESRNGMILSIS